MFLLQLQLAVQLGDGVENLSKVGALEDPEHHGAEGVAHHGAQVGVHRHLEETSKEFSPNNISPMIMGKLKKKSFKVIEKGYPSSPPSNTD